MNPKKILIIEDEKDVRDNIQSLLEEEGYSTVVACNGQEGITKALEISPDLIISDIMMKGVDGYEVLKYLSKQKQTKSIPFIFLTAKVERADFRLGMELGADDYLLKPYKSDELLNAIEARLKRIQTLKASSVLNPKKNVKKYLYNDKIFTRINSQPMLIKINEILYITAESQYTLIYLVDGKSYLIRKSVSYWERVLPIKEFLRIHRSTIINMEYIVKMGKWSSSSLLVYLQNIEKPFIVSKRYSTKFRRNSI